MLNIPTAQPKKSVPPIGGGATLTEQPEAFTPQPYEYAGQGWNDPVAQDVMKEYWSKPGYEPLYEQNMNIAQTYNDTPGVLHSPLDPASWGTTYRGQDYADIGEKYKQAGGTYFDQFSPAQQAGVPYYAATGQPAPVMNMQTGVAETPNFDALGKITGQTPATAATSGSYHVLPPDVINKMWR
jgi:hypothetical protein